jgi:signal transduction histidine kinase
MNLIPHTVKGKFSLLFACLAFVITAVYSIAVVLILFSAEKLLMSSYMESTLDGIIHYDLNQGNAPRLDQFSRLYVEGDSVRPIPERLSELKDGYTEIFGDEDLHVFQMRVNGNRYVLTRYQGDFEEWEQEIWIYGSLLFIVLLVTALLFGHLLAKRAVGPIAKLAGETKKLEAELEAGKLYSSSAFSGPWPNDEIGMLGHGLNSLSSRLRSILQNEKNFSSDVSHELRTQLMVLSSSLELLSESELTPAEEKIVRKSLQTVSKMQSTVSVFLNLFRNNSDMKCPQITVKEAVSRNREAWEMTAEQKGLRFSLAVEGSFARKYNEVLCETLISNIVNNALRYTEEGSVSVTVTDSEIRVEDSGVGIPGEDLPHIFESGYRGKRSGNRGSGIGLSLARKCADALGCRIEVQSTEGRGSVFVIRLSF